MFDAVYIIYLPSQEARLKSITREIERIRPFALRIEFIIGDVFEEANGFPRIGTRGCVMSFRKVFRKSIGLGEKSVLILQDDCIFMRNFSNRIKLIISLLETHEWDFAYLAHGAKALPSTFPIVRVDPRSPVMLTHCCAYSSRAMSSLSQLIDDSITRPAGHPQGGPMYFDGYTNFLRAQRPDLITYCVVPSLAFQMSAASNLTPSRIDSLKFFKTLIDFFRSIKNFIKRLI